MCKLSWWNSILYNAKYWFCMENINLKVPNSGTLWALALTIFLYFASWSFELNDGTNCFSVSTLTTEIRVPVSASARKECVPILIGLVLSEYNCTYNGKQHCDFSDLKFSRDFTIGLVCHWCLWLLFPPLYDWFCLAFAG